MTKVLTRRRTPRFFTSTKALESIPTMTTSDVLADAAKLIDERGHCKKLMENPVDGSLCLIGAIDKASRGHAGLAWDAKRRVQRKLGIPQIGGWNDHRFRTAWRVKRMLRSA